MGRFLMAVAVLLLAATIAPATDEGVVYIEDIWEDAITDDNYQEGGGNSSHYPPGWFEAPEGIYGWTLKGTGDSCNWSWVRARAVDNAEIKRWVHTSTWAVNESPYWSCFYLVNANYSFCYVPRNHFYYMSAFRWHPPYVQRVPPQPVTEPDNPGERTSAYVSPVYVTPYEYDYQSGGGTLSQVVDITLSDLESW